MEKKPEGNRRGPFLLAFGGMVLAGLSTFIELIKKVREAKASWDAVMNLTVRELLSPLGWFMIVGGVWWWLRRCVDDHAGELAAASAVLKKQAKDNADNYSVRQKMLAEQRDAIAEEASARF